ncbi:unnamed protein product, partial [Brachionus calyciflorus]
KVDSRLPAWLLEALEIPESLLQTYDGEHFILKDTDPVDKKRILIFCTEKNLPTLNTTQDWYCDANLPPEPVIRGGTLGSSDLNQVYSVSCRKLGSSL